LRAARPELGIIVLTLMDADGYRRTALAAGAGEFVPRRP
jgi:DNA-binding NarL/FixJ family response regulator